MKKNKEHALSTITEIKVFLLFLLDNIRYPIDRSTVMEVILDNTDELSLDYDQCLAELVESGHLYFDEIDGETGVYIRKK